MKRSIKLVLAILVVLLLGLQFMPSYKNESHKQPSAPFVAAYPVPENIESILKRSCYDCHSNNTQYPWYARVQPVRYWLDRHVEQGTEELNFDEFGNYSNRRRRNKLSAIANSLKERSMPLKSYLLIHHNAKINSRDSATIVDWINRIDISGVN
ncbi:heme-binding domain-containing protein (plasmid) [Mucilaginibacter robiniae]|uniref:Heme-binding domain-containing protein n=1 Tax=Mucilaginibacter robiniae TaxID=2728022 RepID=A0A7L5EDS1_9SPHI|nr:heme-binding domain-containing protein [Mucilaginibacter robiniae]QJD98596.1 heme-binding domain-containing protein [Mucilaginibacter robiniae]